MRSVLPIRVLASSHRRSADLGSVPELEPTPDHASYLQSWLKVLADDKRAIFQAAAHAQRATAFLHGLQPEAANIRDAA
ncbi:hypothetical protein ASC90_25520 [Rhizobium sp. Root1220]|nr:hypothetical protein ASC90_25520 [Rhizobium sp. Root1220]